MEIGSDIQEGSDKISSLCFSSPVLCCRTCISGENVNPLKPWAFPWDFGQGIGSLIGSFGMKENHRKTNILWTAVLSLCHLWVPKEASQDQCKHNTRGLPCTQQNVLQLQLSPLAGQHTWHRVSNTLDRLFTQGCRAPVVILTFLLPSAKSFPVVFSNAVKKAESWFYRIWNMSECITSAVNSLPLQTSNAGFTLFFHLSVRCSAAEGHSA